MTTLRAKLIAIETAALQVAEAQLPTAKWPVVREHLAQQIAFRKAAIARLSE